MPELDFKNPPKNSDYPICPAGIFNAVCVDIVDRGHQPKTWQGKTAIKPRVMLVFQTEERNDLGYRHKLYDTMTVSTHERSKMFKVLSSWIGDELKTTKFDPESLVGRGAQLNVIHEKRDDGSTGVYISAILPKHPRDNEIEAEDYTRYQDKEDWIAPTPSCWESASSSQAAPERTAPAPSPTPAAAPTQASLPTEEIPPPVTPQPKVQPTKTAASQQPASEEELDKFMTFAMDLFEDDKVMGFIQEAAMKITKQDDIRNLTSNQLYQAKMELRNRKPTDFKVKKLELPKAPPLTQEEIDDGLDDDPFENE